MLYDFSPNQLEDLDQKVKLLRMEYSLKSLDASEVNPNPLDQFKIWFSETLNAKIIEPNAMHLATVSPEGLPSGRMVLLKGITEKGLIFYSNYQSRKGFEIEHNSNVALTFFWYPLERQVRIEGKAEKLPSETSFEYFKSRPYESRIGAWVSPQSKVLESREQLLQLFNAAKEKFPQEVPLPPNWGGYLVIPKYFEFWQGRRSRLHDRIAYELKENNLWDIFRLAP